MNKYSRNGNWYARHHFAELAFSFILIIVVMFFIGISVEGEESEGGTDDEIEISLEYGEDEEWDWEWNDLRQLVLLENGVKVDEEMNITLSTGIGWTNDSSQYSPSGRYYSIGDLFGELIGVIWWDDPDISIDEGDFNRSSEDGHTLDVVVLGEYTRTKDNETLLRQVFTTVTIERPNRAPVPVLRIAVDRNWSWHTTETNTTFYLPVNSRHAHNVTFDLSGSFDPDGDPITSWIIDSTLPDFIDGIYDDPDDLPINITSRMNTDRNYQFVFIAQDSLGLNSTFPIIIVELTTWHLEADVTITNVTSDFLFPDINEQVNVSVMVHNSGGIEANFVDVTLSVDGEDQYFRTINRLGPDEMATIIFPFQGDRKEVFNLSFRAWDDGIFVNESWYIDIFVGFQTPNILIESPKDNDQINTNGTISGTVSYDEDSLDEIPIEASIQGDEWKIVAYCTDGEYWQFDLNASDHVNDTILILVRAFDGRQYSENGSVVVKVVRPLASTNTSTDRDSDDTTPSPTLIAGGILLFGTLGLGGLAFLREDLRFAIYSILILPLYSKIRRDDVLREGYRQDIYQYVVSQPGANLTTIKGELGIGHGTVIHHLTVLEEKRLIRSKKEFGRRLFFPNGNGNGNSHHSGTSPGATPELSLIQKRVRDHLRYSGSKTQSELASELGIKQQTVSYTLQRLHAYGLVKGDGEGRGSRYHAMNGPGFDKNS